MKKSISRKINALCIKCLHVWIKIRLKEKDLAWYEYKACHFIHFQEKKKKKYSPVYFSNSFLLLFTKSWFQMNGCMCIHIWFFAVFLKFDDFMQRLSLWNNIQAFHLSFSLEFSTFISFFPSSFSFHFFFRIVLFLNDFCCTLKTYAFKCMFMTTTRIFLHTIFNRFCIFVLKLWHCILYSYLIECSRRFFSSFFSLQSSISS